jgi:lipid-binding SYLF domain-containing protein
LIDKATPGSAAALAWPLSRKPGWCYIGRHNNAQLEHPMRTLIATFLMLLASVTSAASREEINAEVRQALQNFQKQTSAGHELAGKAAGVLVFPNVIKAGIGVGGEYGEGALLIGGKTVAYYNIAAASIGLQLGAQARSQIVLFMDENSLSKFRTRHGWKAGVDGSVALATLGAGGAIDTETARKPIIGFIFSNKGLMYNLTFEGSKITKISK